MLPFRDVWRLANAWYQDPRSATWKPRTIDESQKLLASLGLTGSFWNLTQRR